MTIENLLLNVFTFLDVSRTFSPFSLHTDEHLLHKTWRARRRTPSRPPARSPTRNDLELFPDIII